MGIRHGKAAMDQLAYSSAVKLRACSPATPPAASEESMLGTCCKTLAELGRSLWQEPGEPIASGSILTGLSTFWQPSRTPEEGFVHEISWWWVVGAVVIPFCVYENLGLSRYTRARRQVSSRQGKLRSYGAYGGTARLTSGGKVRSI